MKRLIRYALVPACVFLAACSSQTGPVQDDVLPPPVADRFPVDGEVDLPAVGTVETGSVDLYGGFGSGAFVRTINVSWAKANDDRNLYIGMEWEDATHDNAFDVNQGPLVFDGVRLVFDEDANGTYDDGEDGRTVIAMGIGSQYVDMHKVAAGNDETDAVADGFGKLKYDSGLYTAEFLIPLGDDGTAEDGPLFTSTRFNILFLDAIDIGGGTGNVGTYYPDDANSASWPELDLSTKAVGPHPRIPSGLAGMIAFISDHETANGNGEIYTFDPATRVITKVTNDPNLFKDNISLSHDRTKIAFHGASSRTAYTEYEIYTVDITGANLQQLTTNGVLDGHPAWSPDDSEIAYASFRGGAGASVVVMTSAGVEVQDLTPDTFDDNDPEYLPDGRITFKTSRFSTLPEVRIAVMNGDGSNVQQLTSLAGVSDHDPAGTSTHVLFERFPKATDYSTDPDAGFVNWDIVECTVANPTERTLMADGWINWLPVYDPTGEYIVYLKGSGTTDAHLMTRNGRDLGRLIPNQTKIRYIDWK